MSRSRVGGLLALAVSVCTLHATLVLAEGQRPLPSNEQARVEALARESADAAAATARRWLGNLHPDGRADIQQWLLAARAWKKDARGSSAALLAEGVLFDCLDRTTWLNTGFGSGLAVDPRFDDLGLPRRERALGLFAAALKADPALAEARFRSARIRALDNASGRTDLERIANSDDAEFAYLAAVTRGSIAQAQGHTTVAARWFDRALAIRGTSTAAEIGLIVTRPGSPLRTDRLDPDDPYYTYPCRILTPAVHAAFAQRLAGGVK